MKCKPLMRIGRQVLVVLGVAIIGGATLMGCGPDEEDPCKDVTCDFGVCDSETGQCTNEQSCRTDSACIPGYECGADGTCQALSECEEDADCEAGVCSEAGACVNPETCTENGDCRARTFCATSGESEEGTCEPDPCNDVSCQRGVCKRGTDDCVSASSCTKETQILDCVAGQKCADGECKPPESYCDSITCERGVCNFQDGGCVDAKDCKGEDKNCLAGNFCNEMGQCQSDLCEQNDVECEGNGVCVPSTGTCQNANSCKSSKDCLADHLCVGGKCRLASVACGDAGGDGGCPGNQTCKYDEQNQSASCQEPDVCETSFDCKGSRQCAGRSCLEPETCSEDFFEPNDTSGEATNFSEVARDNTLSASLCQDDTDIYSVDTKKIIDPTARGTMLVELDVPARARGLGKLKMKVTDAEGNELGTANTGAMGADGHIRVPVEIKVPDHGIYNVEVTGGDDLNVAGVDYDLSVNILPSETVKACNDAIPIRVNQRISGNTKNSESAHLGSSCTVQPNPGGERIYELNVDAPQEVTFNLEPLVSNADLTMSLRSRCTQSGSERACADKTGAGVKESLTALVGKGTHYLVVQSPEGLDGGPYNLTVDRVFTACSPQDNYCDKDGMAHVCTPKGGRFQEIECDAGCDPSTGQCKPPEGDICLDAETVNPMNAQTYQPDFTQLNDDYSLQAGGCTGQGEPRTGGPDMTYEVEVPAQKAVTVEALFDNEVEGSIYMVEDCGDAHGTCKIGAQGSTEESHRETLTYANQSEKDETYHLIVDTKEGQQLAGAEVQISYKDVICEPDDKQCDGSGDIEKCGQYGTKWEEFTTCGLGCDSASCRGDTCSDAINIPNSQSDKGTKQSFKFPLNNFASDHNISASDKCTGSSFNGADGKEAVFKLDADKGDIVDIKWAPAENAVMTIATDCSNLSSSCVAGDSEYRDPVDLRWTAQKSQTYYLVADTFKGFSGTNYGSSTLDVVVQQPQCDPAKDGPTCTSNNNSLKYCTSVGLWETLKCGSSGTCSSGKCSPATGEICADAISVSDGDSKSRKYNGSNSLDPEGTGQTGSCKFPEGTAGADFFYEVSLKANEKLTADYNGGSSLDTMYLLKDCSDTTSCVDAVDDDGSITYTAGSSSETVYVVMDHNSYTNEGPNGYGYTVDISVK